MPTVGEGVFDTTRRSQSTTSVDVFRTEDQVQGVQADWEQFLEGNSGNYTIREQPLYMINYLPSQVEGMTPFVVILRDHNGIRCVAPFYKHRRKIPLHFGPIEIPTPTVTLLRLTGERLVHREGSSVAENIRAVLGALRPLTGEFDIVWLPELELPGELWDFFQDGNGAGTGFRLVRLHPNTEVVQMIDLPPTFDEYLAGLKGEDRRNRKRALRKLEQAGEVTMQMFSRREDMRQFFELADSIRNNSWKAKEFGPDRYDNKRVVTFHETIAGRGWARGYILRIDDRPVAFLVGYMLGDTFLAAEWGYDDDTRSLSTGVGLILKMLRHFCEDYGGGRVLLEPTDNRMKRSLGNATYDITNGVIVPDRAFSSRLHFAVHHLIAYQHKRVAGVVKKLRGN